MPSKEEIEKDNTFKMSIPLITNAELNAIDNNLDDFINQITKQVIHDKDLLVAQHIIEKQKHQIDHLEAREQKLIEKLEKEKYTIESTYSQINRNYFMAQDRLDLIKEILEILKGEKE